MLRQAYYDLVVEQIGRAGRSLCTRALAQPTTPRAEFTTGLRLITRRTHMTRQTLQDCMVCFSTINNPDVALVATRAGTQNQTIVNSG
jgi:hypothetical protein